MEKISHSQETTTQAFDLKWSKTDTYTSDASVSLRINWFSERYGDIANADWWSAYSDPVLLDAGCGPGTTAIEVFGERLNKIKYIGVDLSSAIELAKERFKSAGYNGEFHQMNMMDAQWPVDVVFAEGTLHHTDSTKAAIKHLSSLLNPRGRFFFYVYVKKFPIREFTDDAVRKLISGLSEDWKWKALYPLTLLGIILGKISIPFQRWFYYKICKCYYRPDYAFQEMNFVNFDWFSPKNCHRHTPEEIKRFCNDAGLHIDKMIVEPSGITVHASKP